MIGAGEQFQCRGSKKEEVEVSADMDFIGAPVLFTVQNEQKQGHCETCIISVLTSWRGHMGNHVPIITVKRFSIYRTKYCSHYSAQYVNEAVLLP